MHKSHPLHASTSITTVPRVTRLLHGTDTGPATHAGATSWGALR